MEFQLESFLCKQGNLACETKTTLQVSVLEGWLSLTLTVSAIEKQLDI